MIEDLDEYCSEDEDYGDPNAWSESEDEEGDDNDRYDPNDLNHPSSLERLGLGDGRFFKRSSVDTDGPGHVFEERPRWLYEKLAREPDDQCRVEVLKDGPAAMARKLCERANGGLRIIDANCVPGTSCVVPSSYTDLATPDKPGAAFRMTWPKIDENAFDNHVYPGGPPIYGYRQNILGAQMKPHYGERSARTFDTEGQVPGCPTKMSRAFERTRIAAAICEEQGKSSREIYERFERDWNVKVPNDVIEHRKVLSGSYATRMAALADPDYHGCEVAPERSSLARIDQAPFGQDALGKNYPICWQKLRAALRSYSQVLYDSNDELQQTLRRKSVTMYWDIAEGCIPEIKKCTCLAEVLQSLDHLPKFPPRPDYGDRQKDMDIIRLAVLRDMAQKQFEHNYRYDVEGEKVLRDLESDIDPVPHAWPEIPKTEVVVPHTFSSIRPPPKPNIGDLGMDLVSSRLGQSRQRTRVVWAAAREEKVEQIRKVSDLVHYVIVAHTLRSADEASKQWLLRRVQRACGDSSLLRQELYCGDGISERCWDMIEAGFVHDVELLASINRAGITEQNVWKEISIWVSSKTQKHTPTDNYELCRMCVTEDAMWVCRYWMRRCIGKMQHYRTRHLVFDGISGRTMPLHSAVVKHGKDLISQWTEHYRHKARDQSLPYDSQVKAQCKLTTYRNLSISIIQDRVGISFNHSRCRRYIVKMCLRRADKKMFPRRYQEFRDAVELISSDTQDHEQFFDRVGALEPNIWVVTPLQMWRDAIQNVRLTMQDYEAAIRAQVSALAEDDESEDDTFPSDFDPGGRYGPSMQIVRSTPRLAFESNQLGSRSPIRTLSVDPTAGRAGGWDIPTDARVRSSSDEDPFGDIDEDGTCGGIGGELDGDDLPTLDPSKDYANVGEILDLIDYEDCAEVRIWIGIPHQAGRDDFGLTVGYSSDFPVLKAELEKKTEIWNRRIRAHRQGKKEEDLDVTDLRSHDTR